jgi:hypothetical protein
LNRIGFLAVLLDKERRRPQRHARHCQQRIGATKMIQGLTGMGQYLDAAARAFQELVEISPARPSPLAARCSAWPRTSRWTRATSGAVDTPPRRGRRWRGQLFGTAVIIGIVAGPALIGLPVQINGMAYLAGLERTATFNPVSYSQSCDDFASGPCSTRTVGYLSGSGDRVTWEGETPLGVSFPIHAPVWAWGTGRELMNGPGNAVFAFVIGFCPDIGLWVVLIWVVVLAAKRGRRAVRRVLPLRWG